MLACAAWAAPRFKILHMVSGGVSSGVTLDGKGNIFGTTTGGGTFNKGTIFELTPGAHGWTLSIVHNFDGYDGGGGNGGLVFDGAGNLYGTSPAGGAYNGGSVFEMTSGTSGWTFSDLYDFCQQYHCPDGGGPHAGVIFDECGNLYGTTVAGGTSGAGTAFELLRGADSDSWSEKVLYSFGSKPYDGNNPYDTPVFDKAGNLNGVTYYGGSDQLGTVFKLRRGSSGWKERLLREFDGLDGALASSSVVFGGSGDLYGTTVAGGSHDSGVVFKLTPQPNGRWKEIVLYEFPKPENGRFPSSGVIFDKAGNLYGTTSGGGNPLCTGGCGVVYKLAPGAGGKWKYSLLHKFTGRDGGYPDGVVLDGKGNLYGPAYNVVYEITP